MIPALRSLLRSRLLPAGLLGAVLLLDAALAAVPWSPLTNGPLDEPAHLATALLALLALVGGPALMARPVLLGCALAASVLIDLDHLPLYAGVPHVADGGRPYSHSLSTVGVLLLAACLAPRARRVLVALAVGTGLHFLRDIATGPGLQLWWPLSSAPVRLPHALYVAVLGGLAVVSTSRAYRAERTLDLPGAGARRPGPATVRATPPEGRGSR